MRDSGSRPDESRATTGLEACCARAASGHAAAAPPSNVMKSRRLMGLTPKARDHGLSISGLEWQWRAMQQKRAPHVRLGSTGDPLPRADSCRCPDKAEIRRRL